MSHGFLLGVSLRRTYVYIHIHIEGNKYHYLTETNDKKKRYHDLWGRVPASSETCHSALNPPARQDPCKSASEQPWEARKLRRRFLRHRVEGA